MTLLANVPAREVIFVEYIFSSVLKKVIYIKQNDKKKKNIYSYT